MENKKVKYSVLILISLSFQCLFAQDTVSYIGTIGKGKTITFRQSDYSVQLYKKRKRSGIPERTMYFDKDYYRFQYPDKGVIKLLRVNEVIAIRRNDSVFVDNRVYRLTYDEKYHAYDFKRDTSNVLTVQHWVSDSSSHEDLYDIDVAVYDVSPDIPILRLFGFETVSKHVKATGISPPVAIILCSAIGGGVIAWIKSRSEEDDTL